MLIAPRSEAGLLTLRLGASADPQVGRSRSSVLVYRSSSERGGLNPVALLAPRARAAFSTGWVAVVRGTPAMLVHHHHHHVKPPPNDSAGINVNHP
jgi:hypothetical protein